MHRIARETLTAITMLTPTLPTFRAIQLAHRNLRIDAARNFHVRVRFRTLDHPQRGAYLYMIYGRQDGIHVTTYDNGHIHTAYYLCRGLNHSTYRSWHLNDAIAETFMCNDGRIHGEYKVWYPSGQLKSVINYVNDVEIGLHKEWAYNGTLRRHCINLPLT